MTEKKKASSKNKKSVKNQKNEKKSKAKKTPVKKTKKESVSKPPVKKPIKKVSKAQTLYFKLYDELKDSKRYFKTEKEYKRYIKKLAESAPVNQLDLIGSFKKFKKEFLKK